MRPERAPASGVASVLDDVDSPVLDDVDNSVLDKDGRSLLDDVDGSDDADAAGGCRLEGQPCWNTASGKQFKCCAAGLECDSVTTYNCVVPDGASSSPSGAPAAEPPTAEPPTAEPGPAPPSCKPEGWMCFNENSGKQFRCCESPLVCDAAGSNECRYANNTATACAGSDAACYFPDVDVSKCCEAGLMCDTGKSNLCIQDPNAFLGTGSVISDAVLATAGASAFLALLAFVVVFARRKSIGEAIDKRAFDRYNRGVDKLHTKIRNGARGSVSQYVNALATSRRPSADMLLRESDVEFGAKIGEGGYAVVYRGHLQDEKRTPVALKALKASSTPGARAARHAFLLEYQMMRHLNHPCIIRIHGVGRTTDDRGEHVYFIATELARRSLSDVLKTDGLRRELTMATIVDYALDVAMGMAHLHAKRLIHYDLKPANVLIGFDGRAKVCDLGLSDMCDSMDRYGVASQAVAPEDALKGTPGYLAPELVADFRHEGDAPVAPEDWKLLRPTSAADMFSYGMLLWEMLHAPLPTHPYTWNRYKTIIETKYSGYRPRLDPHTPPELAQVITQCWSGDPADRPATFGDVVERLSALRRRLRDEAGPTVFVARGAEPSLKRSESGGSMFSSSSARAAHPRDSPKVSRPKGMLRTPRPAAGKTITATTSLQEMATLNPLYNDDNAAVLAVAADDALPEIPARDVSASSVL